MSQPRDYGPRDQGPRDRGPRDPATTDHATKDRATKDRATTDHASGRGAGLSCDGPCPRVRSPMTDRVGGARGNGRPLTVGLSHCARRANLSFAFCRAGPGWILSARALRRRRFASFRRRLRRGVQLSAGLCLQRPWRLRSRGRRRYGLGDRWRRGHGADFVPHEDALDVGPTEADAGPGATDAGEEGCGPEATAIDGFDDPAGIPLDTAGDFFIDQRSLGGFPRQARTRIPAQLSRGRLRTLIPGIASWALLAVGRDLVEMRLELVALEGALRGTDVDGTLAAAVTVDSIAGALNPLCEMPSPRCPAPFSEQSTLLDLFGLVGGPDIDLDGGGLECLYDTNGDGLIETCCPETGNAVCGPPCARGAPPVDVDRPSSCGAADGFADGYSINWTFRTAPARVLGFGE